MVALDPALLATMSPEELARTLCLDGETIRELSSTIAKNPRSTIEPSGSASDAPGRRAIEGLGAERENQGVVAGLSIEQTIGEGGMGIVRLATQRSLGRKVAVKTVRPDARSERATLHLLREAWVTGSLEHPNVVPVYDLGLDQDGSPIIILKKIDGAPWASVIANADEARRLGVHDLFEHNLRTLIQLCNAVSLAHARGILHRDLKPENVMIGSFGEVYLVDWGIAVSLREDPTGRLRLAKSVGKEIAGTPCYMAPEMLGAGELTERTDVYLLGAVLHEIITGAPPHQGSFAQIVGSIMASDPSYGPDVPAELAAIAKKAMSREPEERFASADELRQRIEWYLRHRGSLDLSSEAAKRLAQMKALVAGGATRDAVYRLFAEARFGFRQAIAASEDNDAARDGLRDAIETMVAFELERGTPEAAAAALAELEKPPESLSLRVKEAREKHERQQARYARLEAQLDRKTGRRTRLALGLIVGGVWVFAPQSGRYIAAHFDDPWRAMLIATAVVAAFAIGVGHWGRESLRKTLVNRYSRAAVNIVFAGQLMLELGCSVLKVPFTTAAVLHFTVWTTLLAAFVVMGDRRMWPALIGYLAMFLVGLHDPSLCWHAMTVAHVGLVLTFIYASGLLQDRRPDVRARAEDVHRNARPSRQPPPNTPSR